jgi:hypothetical protein
MTVDSATEVIELAVRGEPVTLTFEDALIVADKLGALAEGLVGPGND